MTRRGLAHNLRESDKPTDLYRQISRFVPKLSAEEDYKVDEKAHLVTLTEKGIGRVEKYFAVENLADDRYLELNHHLNQGLKAHCLMKRTVTMW